MSKLKIAIATVGFLSLSLVLGCSSASKHDRSQASTGAPASGTTSAPLAPADLGASSSGRGL